MNRSRAQLSSSAPPGLLINRSIITVRVRGTELSQNQEAFQPPKQHNGAIFFPFISSNDSWNFLYLFIFVEVSLYVCTLCSRLLELDNDDDMLEWLDEECGTLGQLIRTQSLTRDVFLLNPNQSSMFPRRKMIQINIFLACFEFNLKLYFNCNRNSCSSIKNEDSSHVSEIQVEKIVWRNIQCLAWSGWMRSTAELDQELMADW